LKLPSSWLKSVLASFVLRPKPHVVVVVVRGDEVGLDGDIFETSSHFFSSKTKTRKRKKKNTTPRGAKTTSSSTTTTKFWLS
jgi:hypothetical protein